MSSISSVGSSANYPPIARVSTASKPAAPPATAAPAKDPDHDGDSDGGGLDVKG